VEVVLRKLLPAPQVKSVNGRSLDVRSRLPNSYSALEQAATTAAAERFARGSISCSLDVKVRIAGQLSVNDPPTRASTIREL
jgi:uncharacterized protein YicC (UPF0701 family)